MMATPLFYRGMPYYGLGIPHKHLLLICHAHGTQLKQGKGHFSINSILMNYIIHKIDLVTQCKLYNRKCTRGCWLDVTTDGLSLLDIFIMWSDVLWLLLILSLHIAVAILVTSSSLLLILSLPDAVPASVSANWLLQLFCCFLLLLLSP